MEFAAHRAFEAGGRGLALSGTRRRGPRIRRKYLQPRIWIPAGIGIGVLAAAEPTPLSLLFGLPLVAAGVALRTWACGHLTKTDELAVSGPYAHVRHPLYLGTLLIVTGFLLAASHEVASAALAGFLAVFFGRYLPRKERSEAMRLAQRHGEAFEAWREAVPPLWPRLRPWKAPPELGLAASRWEWRRYQENHEAGTLLVVVAALLLLWMRPLGG